MCKKALTPTKSLEVLAPAGDITAVAAAVLNGANAIYLGQKDFSARQNAQNFDKDELYSTVSYCHARGVKVYQTLNTLIFDSQFSLACECIKNACDCGIDAFIVQDLGILSIIRQLCPTVRLHASTQMAVHTLKGAQRLKELSFSRVVLARELSLSQIAEISQNVQIETEVFVQGALCMSVSGQCYLSSMVGTRSGNRGNCAGPCRLPFTSSENPANDLSLKDLCLASHIDELKSCGVTSVKIEGRMKRPEYVASASKVYSSANIGEEYDTHTLQAIFSRSGFTDGYLTNKLGNDMFGIRQRDDVVSATSNLLKSIENTYKKEVGIIPLDMKLCIKRGEFITLSATDGVHTSSAVSKEMPQEAINKSVTSQSAEVSLAKLGGTYFKSQSITCLIDDGLSVPMSTLNELRREVCENIMEQRAIVTPIPCKSEIEQQNSAVVKPSLNKITLRGRFERFLQIPQERVSELEYIILPIDEVIDHSEGLKNYKSKVIVEPYRVMYLNETNNIEKLKILKEKGFTKLYATNIAHIQIGNELKMEIFGSAYLNCTNSLAAQSYAEQGVKDLTLSFELNLQDARKIASDIPQGLFIYGYLPLMLFKNCPVKNQFSCMQCKGEKSLRDRMGIRFKIICNRQKYSEMLNSNPLYMADRLNEITPLSFGVLYFTDENAELCSRIITEYQTGVEAYSSFTRGLYYRSV